MSDPPVFPLVDHRTAARRLDDLVGRWRGAPAPRPRGRADRHEN